MDWKKETLQSIWKVNKERLIFVFCSGLLLFILAMPGESRKEQAAQAVHLQEGGVSAGQNGSQGGTAAGGTSAQDADGSVSMAGSSHSQPETVSYEKELEDRIRTILAGVEGVGEVDVLVVLKSSEEKVLRIDQNSSSAVTEEEQSGSSRIIRQQELSESTVLEGQSSAPIVEKEIMPEISGIVISADGGASAVVRTEISEAMQALFGLPAHKIKVLKRVKKGV